jgi:hypothetical protein
MEIEIPLSQGLSLKIDNAPPGMKDYPTAHLQKGFLLLDEGQDLAEEGVGFGVPVLKSGLQTIFPGSVELTWARRGTTWEITARFKLNLIEKISRKGGGILENKALYTVKNILAGVIRQLPIFRNLLTAISSQLRGGLNWETIYADAKLSTEVKVLYSLDGETGKINVEVDSSGLPSNITEVIVMNEQGAHHFDRYLDTSGISLSGEEIGCWDEVNAKEARFESSARRVTFRLDRVKGARLFRGRELVGTRLAWAGFGYSFPPSIMKLRYEMRIERFV